MTGYPLERFYPPLQAASFLAGIGVFDIVGTIASGALTDRIDPRLLLAGYYAFRGAALILLPWALQYSLAGMWPFAVLYGLDWVATVPPTAALCTACFGSRRSAIVFAWCLFFHQVGAAAIAAVAGILRTFLGSYEWAFWSSGVLCIATAIAVLGMQRGSVPLTLPLLGLRGPPPRREWASSSPDVPADSEGASAVAAASASVTAVVATAQSE